MPYQEPAVLEETVFPPSNMVMRPRCLAVIVFSWNTEPIYISNCCSCLWGFSQVTYRMKQPVLFGWKKLQRLGIPGAFPPVCSCLLVECCGFPPLKICVRGGLWGDSPVPTLLTSQVHDCIIKAAQGVFRLAVSPSQWKQSFVRHWAVMNHKLEFLENETLQSKVFFTCKILIARQVCLLVLLFLSSVNGQMAGSTGASWMDLRKLS